MEKIDIQFRINSLNALNHSTPVSKEFFRLQKYSRPIESAHDRVKVLKNQAKMLKIVTRSGRAVRINHKKSTKRFGNNVSLMVKALNALHIESREESTLVGVPAIPFESLTIEQAIFEYKATWETSLLDELNSHEENNTLEIIEGNYSSTNGRKLISSSWVLRNKL